MSLCDVMLELLLTQTVTAVVVLLLTIEHCSRLRSIVLRRVADSVLPLWYPCAKALVGGGIRAPKPVLPLVSGYRKTRASGGIKLLHPCCVSSELCHQSCRITTPKLALF